MNAEARLLEAWYAPGPTPLAFALGPLVLLYAGAIAARRMLFRLGLRRSKRLAVPVVVVGNITVGGSGKTPLVAALGRALAARGWSPGVVSRGYGRGNPPGQRREPLLVRVDDDPLVVGDEPLLLARAGLPVAVARDRVAAGEALLVAHPHVDVVLADDGLQHYRLGRDVEIAVIDGRRGLGNGWLLPAGPLREPSTRLASVDAIVVLDDRDDTARRWPGAFRAELVAADLRRVNAPDERRTAAEFAGDGLHAVAGIGNPQRFFATLRRQGIRATPHAFPDHHRFTPADLAFPGASAILMTEKDAVKCTAFADARCWYLPVQAHIDPALVERVEETIRGSQAA